MTRTQKCDRCGLRVYDFRQWLGGGRTCLACTEALTAIEACHICCPRCEAGLSLASGREVPLGSDPPRRSRRDHTLPDGTGRGQRCNAAGIRARFGLGDGPLEDWYSERRRESQ